MDMKEILKSGIEQALQDTINSGDLPAGEYPEIVLEVPPQKEFGDFSTNIAMQSARVARQNPRAIAEALISHMNFDWLERAEVAGAGFINFFLKSDMVYDTLKAILNAGTEVRCSTIACARYDSSRVRKCKPYRTIACWSWSRCCIR